MFSAHIERLQAIAARLRTNVDRQSLAFKEHLVKLEEAATKVAVSWSGSSIGYHANVYYLDFEMPPAGEHFDIQWGFNMPFGLGRESSHWREYVFQDVYNEIYIEAGDPNLAPLKQICGEVAENFRGNQSRFDSLISSAGKGLKDEYLDSLRSKAAGLLIPTVQDLINFQLPKGTVVSRDVMATSSGIRHAPHQAILAEIYALRAPFEKSQELLVFCELAIDHMRLTKSMEINQHNDSKSGPSKALVDRVKSLNLHPTIYQKCCDIYESGLYPEAVEKGFKVVRDRLRILTSYETGSEAFGKGNLHIRGAAAPNVEDNFNNAVKYLTMAIDQFRNEKAHTSDANVDSERALEYLTLSSLAMHLLEKAEIGSPRGRSKAVE